MDNKIIYEYYIKDGEFKKRKFNILRTTKERNKVVYVIKPSNYVFLRIGDFDKVKNNRIFSFHDNEEQFKNMMIEYYKNRIQKEKQNIIRLESICMKLQEEV